MTVMRIDVAAGPGYRPPLVQAYQRWAGVCTACETQVQPGEWVTWVPQTVMKTRRTYRMRVIHARCAPAGTRYDGRSCTPEEYAWLMALAGIGNG